MGAVTPLGESVGEVFKAQLEGRSGVSRVEHFNASRFPTTFAAQVKNFDLLKHLGVKEDRWANCGVNTRFALAAAKQALADAAERNEKTLELAGYEIKRSETTPEVPDQTIAPVGKDAVEPLPFD